MTGVMTTKRNRSGRASIFYISHRVSYASRQAPEISRTGAKQAGACALRMQVAAVIMAKIQAPLFLKTVMGTGKAIDGRASPCLKPVQSPPLVKKPFDQST